MLKRITTILTICVGIAYSQCDYSIVDPVYTEYGGTHLYETNDKSIFEIGITQSGLTHTIMIQYFDSCGNFIWNQSLFNTNGFEFKKITETPTSIILDAEIKIYSDLWHQSMWELDKTDGHLIADYVESFSSVVDSLSTHQLVGGSANWMLGFPADSNKKMWIRADNYFNPPVTNRLYFVDQNTYTLVDSSVTNWFSYMQKFDGELFYCQGFPTGIGYRQVLSKINPIDGNISDSISVSNRSIYRVHHHNNQYFAIYSVNDTINGDYNGVITLDTSFNIISDYTIYTIPPTNEVLKFMCDHPYYRVNQSDSNMLEFAEYPKVISAAPALNYTDTILCIFRCNISVNIVDTLLITKSGLGYNVNQFTGFPCYLIEDSTTYVYGYYYTYTNGLPNCDTCGQFRIKLSPTHPIPPIVSQPNFHYPSLLYPNPSTGIFTFALDSSFVGPVLFEVFYGFSGPIFSTMLSNGDTLDLSYLDPGYYYYHISMGGITIDSKPFIKL